MQDSSINQIFLNAHWTKELLIINRQHHLFMEFSDELVALLFWNLFPSIPFSSCLAVPWDAENQVEREWPELKFSCWSAALSPSEVTIELRMGWKVWRGKVVQVFLFPLCHYFPKAVLQLWVVSKLPRSLYISKGKQFFRKSRLKQCHTRTEA